MQMQGQTHATFTRRMQTQGTPSSFPGPHVFLNDISSGPGNSNKYDFFDWSIQTACVIRSEIIRFYALDFTSGLRNIQLRRAFPSGCVQYRNKVTTLTKSVLNFHKEISFVTEISTITVIQFRCLVKRLKSLKMLQGLKQASLKMLQE